jgi:hypothetical protein
MRVGRSMGQSQRLSILSIDINALCTDVSGHHIRHHAGAEGDDGGVGWLVVAWPVGLGLGFGCDGGAPRPGSVPRSSEELHHQVPPQRFLD